MRRTAKKIRDRLAAELAADAPDPERVTRLANELRVELRRRGREGISGEISQETSREVSDDPDAEAIKSWPPALRARLGQSAYSRVIDGRPVDDPGAHGQRNDLRRWSPWR